MRRPFFCRPSGPEIVFLGIQGQARSAQPLDLLKRARKPRRGDRFAPPVFLSALRA